MAEPTKSPYSAKPSSLNKPVPGAEAEAEANDFLASYTPPSAPMQADAAAAEADQFLSGGGEAPSPTVAPTQSEIPADQFAQEPGFLQANMEQFNNFATRVQAGLASTDTQKLNLLKQKYGKNNATIKDDKLYFRKSEKDKFQRLDPATLEVVNDLIPDFAREIVTEAAMLPGEVAGATAAVFAGLGAGAPITVPAGVLAGRIASVPLANEAADKVAELAGVPADEARNKTMENAIGMAAEAFLPVVGRQVSKQIMKRLPGTMAYKAAKEAGEREVVALSKQSQEVAAAVDNLAQQGRAAQINGELVGIPEAKVSLMGHQLNPDNPLLKSIADFSASDPKFINAQNQLAEDWGAALTNTLAEIGRRNNKGPYRPEVLAASVTNAVNDLAKAEGKAIGQFKNKAMAVLKNKRIPVDPQTSGQVQDLMKEFGFVIRPGKNGTLITPPKDLNSLVGKMGLTSIGEVRAVVNNLNELVQTGKDGGLRITDLDRLRNSIGSTADSLFRTQAGARLGQLSGNLRQLYRDGIKLGLPDEFERKAFDSAMDDFSQLKMNIGVLKNALNEDSSAKAIVKSIFTGKENLQKINAIKQVSPESFSALKEEWINQMLTEFSSRSNKTGVRSKDFLDAIDKKYGKQFVGEVLNDGPGPNLDTVRQILTVTERIEQTTRGVRVDNMDEKQKKAIMDAAIGMLANIKFKVMNGVTALFTGKNQALMDIMTRDGIDKYVSNYPGRIDKKTISSQLSQMLAEHKVYKGIIRATESDAAARAARAGVKGEMQRGVQE